MKNLLFCWVLLVLVWTTSAQADIRLERIIPTNPTSDFAPTAEIWVSGSYGLVTSDFVGTVGTLDADSVTVIGNNVRLQIPVLRRAGSGVNFGVPVPGSTPHTKSYLLPRLAPGSYTLEVIGRPAFTSDPLFNIASVPLIIGIGSFVEVPLLTNVGLALLMLAILALGIRGAE